MQRLRNILAITAVRLSIAYTAIFGFVAVVIVFYMTATTANILRKQISDSINEEVAQLVQVYEAAGINGLVRRLERSAAAPGANIYVIANPSGQIVAGNVLDIAPGVIEHVGWTLRPFKYSLYSAGRERQHLAIARVMQLPNSMRLLIGRDLGEPERYRSAMARAVAFSIAAMLVLGLATWILIGRRALKRLESVSQSSARILAGDRSERLPLSGSGDDFDQLSSGLNAMLDRISKLDDGLRQVSDNIAHDLKTPLTRLRNKAEAALSSARGGKKQSAALREVIVDTDQIIRTFDALLMISRVESGSMAAELVPLDVSRIVADVAELYQPVADEEGFGFETSIAPALWVRGNRELLAQALSNLIDNAVKHGRAVSSSISVSLSSDTIGALIAIADNGQGIAEQDRAKVVERFFRLDQSRSLPGNGLGLSLVRAVAQLHGGVLEFASNQPGVKVVLRLPLVGEPKAAVR